MFFVIPSRKNMFNFRILECEIVVIQLKQNEINIFLVGKSYIIAETNIFILFTTIARAFNAQ